ncbi:MAG: transcription termination factor Rho [Synergistaceae bacterium]|nr:transcription termination factor Rho [Synergistaceae bacterium]
MPRKKLSQENELEQEFTRKLTNRKKKSDTEITPDELVPQQDIEFINEDDDDLEYTGADLIEDDDFNDEDLDDEGEQDIQEDEDNNAQSAAGKNKFRENIQHPKPEFTYSMLSKRNIADLRRQAKEYGLSAPVSMRKDDLIFEILRLQAEKMNYRFGGGTLEILPENFGFLRPKGMLPTDNDVYLSSSQIRRFGLRNGDVIWGLIRPPRDQEHYEALLRVETVNFSDPEHSRRRPVFAQLTPIFPDKKLSLEYDPKDLATRLVDLFAPIGLGQRALLVSPPKAGKTTLLKRIAQAIAASKPDIIIMALLIDERPEEVTDISRSIDGEVIASTFDRPADEHIRVANLALEKAKRLVEAKRDVVILLDSITRLARASNLTVPPSGRTLSGGLDPSGLYFPKRFFGAARNFEEGGSLTIIGTALTDTGSRMDDVIYEEFKGTGNMELHLSRKLAEQRIFPAIDITKSGTRREELLIPDEELKRMWVLRKRIAGVDEAGALSLILDKLKQTQTNAEFLNAIKVTG